jgi:hypothetical protein
VFAAPAPVRRGAPTRQVLTGGGSPEQLVSKEAVESGTGGGVPVAVWAPDGRRQSRQLL